MAAQELAWELVSGGLLYALTAITKHLLMAALRMAITDPNGFRAACLSAPDLGITALIAFTGTSITIWMCARVTADNFLREESVLSNSGGSSAVKRCITHAAAKLRAGGKVRRKLRSFEMFHGCSTSLLTTDFRNCYQGV